MFRVPPHSDLQAQQQQTAADAHLFSRFQPAQPQLDKQEVKTQPPTEGPQLLPSVSLHMPTDAGGQVATSLAPPTTNTTDKPTVEGNNNGQSSTSSQLGAPAKGLGGSKNAVVISTRQRQNPLLKFIRNVPYELSNDIVADYVFSKTTVALFLSLKYHQLNPEYIHHRMKLLGKGPELTILLVWADVRETSSRQHLLRELNKICLNANYTMLLGWSPEEMGFYVETLKAYEHKPPTLLMGNKDGMSDAERIAEFFATVKGVNKTDSKMLMETFGSIAGAIKATQDDLNLVPGFGFKKAQKLHAAFREPFKKLKKGD